MAFPYHVHHEHMPGRLRAHASFRLSLHSPTAGACDHHMCDVSVANTVLASSLCHLPTHTNQNNVWTRPYTPSTHSSGAHWKPTWKQFSANTKKAIPPHTTAKMICHSMRTLPSPPSPPPCRTGQRTGHAHKPLVVRGPNEQQSLDTSQSPILHHGGWVSG